LLHAQIQNLQDTLTGRIPEFTSTRPIVLDKTYHSPTSIANHLEAIEMFWYQGYHDNWIRLEVTGKAVMSRYTCPEDLSHSAKTMKHEI
jgi:hypothetical protein